MAAPVPIPDLTLQGATDYSSFYNNPVFGNVAGPVITPYSKSAAGPLASSGGPGLLLIAAAVAVAVVVAGGA